MGVSTSNSYGRIHVTDEAIAQVVGTLALGTMGVADLVSKKFSDSLSDIFKKKRSSRGVRVFTNGDVIHIDLFVYIKYGMPIQEVSELLIKSIQSGVEEFTGMLVTGVNVNIIGVKL